MSVLDDGGGVHNTDLILSSEFIDTSCCLLSPQPNEEETQQQQLDETINENNTKEVELSTNNKSEDMLTIDTSSIIPTLSSSPCIHTTSPQGEANSSSSASSSLLAFNLNDMLNQLDENYERTEEKINETFDVLREALDCRKSQLLNELKCFYEEKRATVSIHSNSGNGNNNNGNDDELLLERFDLDTRPSTSLAICQPNSNKLDPSLLLSSVINNYGSIVRLKPTTTLSLFECIIEG